MDKIKCLLKNNPDFQVVLTKYGFDIVHKTITKSRNHIDDYGRKTIVEELEKEISKVKSTCARIQLKTFLIDTDWMIDASGANVVYDGTNSDDVVVVREGGNVWACNKIEINNGTVYYSGSGFNRACLDMTDESFKYCRVKIER